MIQMEPPPPHTTRRQILQEKLNNKTIESTETDSETLLLHSSQQFGWSPLLSQTSVIHPTTAGFGATVATSTWPTDGYLRREEGAFHVDGLVRPLAQ